MKSIVAIAAIAFCSVAVAGQDEVLKNSQSSVSSSASVSASKQLQMAQSMGGSTTTRSQAVSESMASQAADTVVTMSRCKTVHKNGVRQELCVTQTRHPSPQEAEMYIRQLEK